jgi:hypothetical protein
MIVLVWGGFRDGVIGASRTPSGTKLIEVDPMRFRQKAPPSCMFSVAIMIGRREI